MGLSLPAIWSERCRLHEPGGEIWVGVRTPGTEIAARTDAILVALREEGAPLVEAEEHSDSALEAVHDRALIEFLAGAYAEWTRAGLDRDPGQDRVVPYVFAHSGLMRGRAPTVPAAVWARPGYFAYDTMTLVGPGTWEAARAAVDVALTAVGLVKEGGLPAAYACCRPPGHHVTASCYGGSCYLNNAAVAAAAFESAVAVLDIDAHHGNGTQEIFYARDDVLVGSVHVDPGAGWFPHFLGFAEERGEGAGEGANRNIPLAPGSGDDAWLDAIRNLTSWIRAAGTKSLVVSLGVDAAAGDPESPLRVTPAGFREAGRVLGGLRLPTVLVQEGGYDLEAIGPLVREVLLGFEESRA